MSRSKPVVLMMLAAVLFSTSGLFIKITTVSPLALVGGRSFVAMLVLGLFFGRPSLPRARHQFGGALAICGAQILFVLATRQTTAANAIFIQFVAPVFVAVLGVWYLGERARPQDWLTMGIVAAGLALFFGEELTPAGLWGNINALLSGVCLAWFILFLRKARADSPLNVMFWGNVLAAAAGVPFLLLAEQPTAGDWGSILFLGIFQLGLPLILMSIAIRSLTAVETVLIKTLEPILNPVWVFLVVGERPAPLALLGGIVVLGGITWRSLQAARAVRLPPSSV